MPRHRFLGLFGVFCVSLLALVWWRSQSPEALVVYCAHDAIHAEKVLRDFEKQTGIPVSIRFDTEATKSLGLVELLIREKDAPRCDVFWNNELLGTLDLQERGILEPYKGTGFARIPAAFKDPAGHWAGFAARLRVYIFNTRSTQVEGRPTDPELPFEGSASLASAVKIPWPSDPTISPRADLSRMAMAKPLYGTTLTHYCVLWNAWGGPNVEAWHRDWRRRNLRELNGNAAVKDAVAEGVCDSGWTDTDDFFEAKDAGKPVAMMPVRLKDNATICIPNTVAIIRGAKHAASARKLVDFLLSEETELALANSRSRQIPLGPVPAERLPAEVRELVEWAKDGVDLKALGPARAACLAWLKAESLR
jgi:iron(III) transport system substrate-binding protein